MTTRSTPESPTPAQVVLLVNEGPLASIVYHALKREFPGLQAIVEDSVPRTRLLKRRIKKLGPVIVGGQVLFMALVLPILRRTGKRRIEDIKQRFALDDAAIDDTALRVPSINSDEARQALQKMDPKIVVVFGTRIIGRATLSAVPAPFINMHAGITPLYRGVHGAYWALAEGRSDLAGTTVHFVDRGIDTGVIIEQAICRVSSADTFVTYPYLQTAVGLPLLVKAVRAGLNDVLAAGENDRPLPSKLRSHPTLWTYVGTWLSKGVK